MAVLLLLVAVFVLLFISMGLLKVGKADTRTRKHPDRQPRKRS